MYFNSYNEKIVFVGKTDSSPMLSCVLAGVTYPNSGYNIYRNPCDVYVFEYVVSGEGVIEVGSEKIPVHGGMFYCIRKGIEEYHYADNVNPYEKIWINLDGDIVEKMFGFFALGDVYCAEVNVMNIFIEIHDRLERMDETNAADTNAEVMRLLFDMLTYATKDKFFPSSAGGNTLDEKIRTYIDVNIYNDISLDTIAAEFRITKMHVIRVFKQKYGTTPIQYILDRKISIAKSLLTGTVMPIKEIASLLRYSNTQHFSGSFKKAVGCTPNKYRQTKR